MVLRLFEGSTRKILLTVEGFVNAIGTHYDMLDLPFIAVSKSNGWHELKLGQKFDHDEIS